MKPGNLPCVRTLTLGRAKDAPQIHLGKAEAASHAAVPHVPRSHRHCPCRRAVGERKGPWTLPCQPPDATDPAPAGKHDGMGLMSRTRFLVLRV